MVLLQESGSRDELTKRSVEQTSPPSLSGL